MQNMIRFFYFVILIFSCSSLQELHAFTNNTIVSPQEGPPGPTESVWQIPAIPIPFQAVPAQIVLIAHFSDLHS
ncbi:hypothetical protein [Criblamydia sequanensis]|uniref:hypothetical protein n=1 Tax=Candidatus Criblamydia sequanensis TaxID=340071 RepID=UPI0012ABC3BC|nr:hypothetical protein [Criblamydia sequanensis]